ncbi:MAG: hypothetical protein KDM91_23195 [Verrucomicrobiae bacterium]|nr:hypothetical protein [Verrucomicrobiae bacterium]MCP5540695.1 hypothetical protein [Akkermansiaceae bacterium]
MRSATGGMAAGLGADRRGGGPDGMSEATGAVMRFRHFGHGPDVPALLAGTFSWAPQAGQEKDILSSRCACISEIQTVSWLFSIAAEVGQKESRQVPRRVEALSEWSWFSFENRAILTLSGRIASRERKSASHP